MANTIVFSSAFVRTVSMVLDEGKRIRINVTASLTKEVREKMEWGDPVKSKGAGRTIDEAATSIDLSGELQGRTLTLTPNDKELRKLAIEFDIAEVKHFQLVTMQGQDGASARRELRFQIITTAPGALGMIEQYADSAGQAKGELKVSYIKQDTLDLQDKDEDEKTEEE